MYWTDLPLLGFILGTFWAERNVSRHRKRCDLALTFV